jgi:DNA invertase Pin-like site-specific DNA recombinase
MAKADVVVVEKKRRLATVVEKTRDLFQIMVVVVMSKRFTLCSLEKRFNSNANKELMTQIFAVYDSRARARALKPWSDDLSQPPAAKAEDGSGEKQSGWRLWIGR